MKRTPRRRGKHASLADGLRFYKLKRIRDSMLFIRKHLDTDSKKSIPLSKLQTGGVPLDDVLEALRSVCRTRKLRVVVLNGIVTFRPKAVQAGL
jgi:hypothetical protein